MSSSDRSDRSKPSSSSGEGKSDESSSQIEEEKSRSSNVKSLSISWSQDMKSSQNKSKSNVTNEEDNDKIEKTLISDKELIEKIQKEDDGSAGIAVMQSQKVYGPPQTLAQSNYSDIANSIPKVECEILEEKISKFQKITSKENNSQSLVNIKDDKTPTFSMFSEEEDIFDNSHNFYTNIKEEQEEDEEEKYVFWSNSQNMRGGNLITKLVKIQEKIETLKYSKTPFDRKYYNEIEEQYKNKLKLSLDELNNSDGN
jgi:hypothetical protein